MLIKSQTKILLKILICTSGTIRFFFLYKLYVEDSQLEILLAERIALFFGLSIILITFSLCMASTISWLRCWNISNRLQVKITADSLQLRLCCLRALYKKTKCPHRESDILSEFSLNNIESATISA